MFNFSLNLRRISQAIMEEKKTCFKIYYCEVDEKRITEEMKK